MKPPKLGFICGLLFLAITGCVSNRGGAPGNEAFGTQVEQQSGPRAIVHLNPTKGFKANGIVTFTTVTNGVRVQAGIMSLAPGVHAFHVHEYGDCSAPDASSAGPHFNPGGKPQGGLGNFTVDAIGEAHLDFVTTHIQLTGSNSIIGRSLIVHAGPDDPESPPLSNSGLRIACGVIEKQ